MADTPAGLEATIVLCARVKAGEEKAFRAWCGRWQGAMLESPGSESFELLPPTPDQDETAAVARFATVDAARVWRHSEDNQTLIDEAKPLVEGGLLMQLTGRAAIEYYIQHSATEVIITKIKAGSEDDYRKFAARIQKVQETFPGYIGSFVQPPHQKELGWTTVLRFDSVGHLNAWMTSTQRAELLKEAEPLIVGFEAQRVDTSFPGWVAADPATGRPPSIWKTATLVLLTLFPVVMLELKFLNPHLRGLPPSVGTFIGNAISVTLTTWPLMPLAIRAFRPWLFPEGQPPALVRAMPVILVACYAVEIAIFWRLL